MSKDVIVYRVDILTGFHFSKVNVAAPYSVTLCTEEKKNLLQQLHYILQCVYLHVLIVYLSKKVLGIQGNYME